MSMAIIIKIILLFILHRSNKLQNHFFKFEHLNTCKGFTTFNEFFMNLFFILRFCILFRKICIHADTDSWTTFKKKLPFIYFQDSVLNDNISFLNFQISVYLILSLLLKLFKWCLLLKRNYIKLYIY